MPCTSLCSIGGTLMRRTSPCTRIMGGRPEDKCRSDALFFTTKASSSVKSIRIPPAAVFFAVSSHYGNNRRQPASHKKPRARGDIVGSVEGPERRQDPPGARRRPAGLRRELRAGSLGKDESITRARMAPDR